MSAASKGKAQRPWKVREQVARELAANIFEYGIERGDRWACVAYDVTAGYGATPEEARGECLRKLRNFLLSGEDFNVHAAREHARALVALADEQTAFEYWARGRGKGPENREPGAFMGITKHTVFAWLPDDGTFNYDNGCADGTRQGGLDVYYKHEKLGRLAKDAGPEALAELVTNLRAHGFEPVIPGGWPGNLAREWARQGGDRRAPMGRSLARLGRRILAALEGQPSKCQACGGNPETQLHRELTKYVAGQVSRKVMLTHEHANLMAYQMGLICHHHGFEAQVRPEVDFATGHVQLHGIPQAALVCPDCQGTGHNLAGYLPEPEVSPQLRRKRADQGMDADGVRSTSDTWLDTELGQWAPGWGLFRVAPSRCAQVHTPDDLERGEKGLTHRTRVTPRGEHRHTGAWPSAAEAHRRAPKGSEQRRDALDRLISERLWDCYSSPDFGLHWPRWRRGAVIRAGSIRVVTQPGPIRVTCEFSIK